MHLPEFPDAQKVFIPSIQLMDALKGCRESLGKVGCIVQSDKYLRGGRRIGKECAKSGDIVATSSRGVSTKSQRKRKRGVGIRSGPKGGKTFPMLLHPGMPPAVGKARSPNRTGGVRKCLGCEQRRLVRSNRG